MAKQAETSPEEIEKRLARIAGHAASLKKFWQDGRECEELLTQIAAVRAALDQVGRVILEHHIEHCVQDAIENKDSKRPLRDIRKALGRLL